MQYASCNFCGLQNHQSNMLFFDTPVYQSQNDSIKIINRKICKNCTHIIINIQLFVHESQAQFSNHKFKSHVFEYYPFLQITNPKKSIQLVYETTVQEASKSRKPSDMKHLNTKRLSMPERVMQELKEQIIHPYISMLIEEIIYKNYLTMQHLPKTLQYFIYLTSTISANKSIQIVIAPEERHEKIKNVILFLSEKINVTIEELPDVLFLVNFLLCFMDASKAINVIIQLSNILIAYPHLLTWKTFIIDEERPNNQTPHSPATVDMRTALISIDRLWIKIQYIIDISRRGESILREGLIRISKIDENCEQKEYKKRVSQILKMVVNRKEELQLLSEQQLQLLYLMKLQRNGLNLILREIMEQEEGVRTQIHKIEHKFRLEKDEYIQKIVKLNNRIQSLENQIKELTQNSLKKSISAESSKKKQEEIQEVQEEVVEKGDQDYRLQEIVTLTNLFGFNRKYFPSDNESDFSHHFSQQIVEEITKMQNVITKLSNKIRNVEEQKTRLLEIISRKQERLLGVIMQKDTTIQKYEQALWTMQNGLEVIQGPLVNRIKYIMHVFGAKNQKRKSMEELMPQETFLQKQENFKKKEKNCQIY